MGSMRTPERPVMTSSAARQAFDSLPEAVRRGILDGDALRLYAVRVPVPPADDEEATP